MSEVDALVNRAMAEYKAGRKEEARTLLMDAVDKDEHHEQAWLWLSALVDTLEEQQICLENVLSINPKNESARKGLDSISQKLAAQGKKPAPSAKPAAPAPPPRPFGGSSSAPIGAEFFDKAGDDWLSSAASGQASFASGSSAPQTPPAPDDAFDSWLAAASGQSQPPAPGPDPSAPPSSVDWGRPDAPAAHGSGKQVDLPSEQEYDDWVKGLNLAADEPVPPRRPESAPASNNNTSPFFVEDLAPFGDTSFMVDSGPSAPGLPAADRGSTPFGDGAQPWGSEMTLDEPFAAAGQPRAGAEPASPFGRASSFDESGMSAFTAVEGFESGDFGTENVFDTADNFTFEEEEQPAKAQPAQFNFDERDTAWAEQRLQAVSRKSAPAFSTSKNPAAVKTQEYFQYIPADVIAKEGGTNPQGMLMLVGIVVLAVLNLVSFGYLLSSL